MALIKIDPDVPIPVDDDSWRSGRDALYPFPEMNTGDSFKVTLEQLGSVRSLCSRYGLKLGRTFVVRPHAGGWRCWRVG